MMFGANKKHRYLAGVMTIALVEACLATPAIAQAINPNPATAGQVAPADPGIPAAGPEGATEPAASEQGPGTPNSDVVVTGSRVIKNGNSSPTPVTVVTTQELLALQPTSVAQGLATLPALLGSVGTNSNVNTGGYNVLNLRGVGLTRGLILFDGLRVGPTQGFTGSQAGTTNIDVIPQVLLQRVDVVTGGASAVYGSDAVSGVVNFVPDSRFNGLKVDVTNGLSTYGDDRRSNIDAAFGTKFAGGHGHIELAYEHRDNAGAMRAGRSFLNSRPTEQGSVPGGGSPGSATNPFILTQGAVLSTSTFGGLIVSGPLSGLQFNPNGTLATYTHGAASGTTGVEYGGDGDYYVGSSLIPKQIFNQGYGRVDYELGSSINLHAQGAYTALKQAITQQSILLNKIAIGYNNPYLSAVQAPYAGTITAALAATPTGSFQLSEINTSLPANQLLIDQRYWLADFGMDGSLGSKFKWNFDYYHTESTLQQTNPSNISNARLAAALNAVRDSSGNIVCNAALANPSVYGGCVPLNVLGTGAASPAAIAYVQQATSQKQKYIQNAVTATISGDAFTLPAGPVTVALNGEWRRQSLGVTSTATSTDPVNCTGIQFNCSATTAPYFSGAATPLNTVSQDVEEAAIESNIPILAGKPLFDDLSLNAAARFTHYTTSGNAFTWKLGAVWKASDAITLRVTRSRDIRAPSLLDLFAPTTFTVSQYVDLHTNTSGIINRRAQGNPDLEPEKANTLTAGVVLKPGFVPGFTLAVDYYQINVGNAIVQNDPFQTTSQAACEATGGTSPLCALYVRPLPFSNTTAANYPTLLINQSLNIASVRTRGVDIEANYQHHFGERLLALRGLVNWQPKLTFDNGPSGILEAAGAADGLAGIPPIAKVKVVASAAFDLVPDINLRLQERWRSSLKQNASPLINFADGNVKSVGYTDANLAFRVNDHFNLSLNVQNLFNTKPPLFASSGGSIQPNYLGGFAQGDDIEGRYMTVSAHMRW